MSVQLVLVVKADVMVAKVVVVAEKAIVDNVTLDVLVHLIVEAAINR
jgi:hypothetical protein